MSSQKIPQSDSIQELAKFWDTHDLTGFEDQLDEVTEPVFERELSITIPLSATEAEAVKRMAKSRGIDPFELIRQWIRQNIQPEN